MQKNLARVKRSLLHLKKLQDILTSMSKCTSTPDTGLISDDEKLKAFYHFAKFVTINPFIKEKPRYWLDMTFFMDSVLKGVSIKRFIQYFPPEKFYDGAKYEMKDYFTTIRDAEKHGNTINDTLRFLWDYMNPLINDYVVCRNGLLGDVVEQQTGKSMLEHIFPDSTFYLQNIGGKEVLYDPRTGKTKPFKRFKRKPKWIKAVK